MLRLVRRSTREGYAQVPIRMISIRGGGGLTIGCLKYGIGFKKATRVSSIHIQIPITSSTPRLLCSIRCGLPPPVTHHRPARRVISVHHPSSDGPLELATHRRPFSTLIPRDLEPWANPCSSPQPLTHHLPCTGGGTNPAGGGGTGTGTAAYPFTGGGTGYTAAAAAGGGTGGGGGGTGPVPVLVGSNPPPELLDDPTLSPVS